MSGDPEIIVPPSQINFGAINAGQWYRAIPPLGANQIGQPTPPTGIADCTNLLAMSPPTLLEAYDLFSYSIGMAAGVQHSGAGFASAPQVTLELALLVNDRPRLVVNSGALQAPTTPAAPGSYLVSDSFVSDLVNPIRLGARDRLSLRAGINCSESTDVSAYLWVGIQAWTASNGIWQPTTFESTISYNVIELPASRRL